MKIRTIVNDLSIDGKEHPKGAKLDVEDEVGKRLVQCGLVREVKGRKAVEPAEPTEPKKERGGAK